MLVRARATRRLKEEVHLFEPDRNLPKLADALEEMLNERQVAAQHLRQAVDDKASDEEESGDEACDDALTDVEECFPLDDGDSESDDEEEEEPDDAFNPSTHYNPANVTVEDN